MWKESDDGDMAGIVEAYQRLFTLIGGDWQG
jgi:hypothetical protein